MTTLSDIRTRIRKDLHDTDSLACRWTDVQLDRHIERALNELSVAIPQEKLAAVATTNGSREASVVSLTGLIAIEAIEYPVGQYPPLFIAHSRWADTVLLHADAIPTGANARFSYTAKHVLDGSGSTVPTQFEDLLATGAAGYAALELSSFATERINVRPARSLQSAAQGACAHKPREVAPAVRPGVVGQRQAEMSRIMPGWSGLTARKKRASHANSSAPFASAHAR